jgi:hypothetical protein
MPALHPTEIRELDGPDYVAVVIEWDDIAWNDEEPTRVSAHASSPLHGTTASVVGALSALALATWGLYRLHAAS